MSWDPATRSAHAALLDAAREVLGSALVDAPTPDRVRLDPVAANQRFESGRDSFPKEPFAYTKINTDRRPYGYDLQAVFELRRSGSREV